MLDLYRGVRYIDTLVTKFWLAVCLSAHVNTVSRPRAFLAPPCPMSTRERLGDTTSRTMGLAHAAPESWPSRAEHGRQSRGGPRAINHKASIAASFTFQKTKQASYWSIPIPPILAKSLLVFAVFFFRKLVRTGQGLFQPV